MNFFIFLVLFSFGFCLVLTWGCILFFRHFKIGQSIREEGPKSHAVKAGTPTMGGAAIVISMIASCLIFFDFDGRFYSLIFLILGFAAIGFLDDLLSVLHGKNTGLLPWQKMGLQIVVAITFGSYLLLLGHETSVSGVLRWLRFDLGWLYLPLITFMIVGFSNAANLTDGLDGLLSGCMVFSFGAFFVIAAFAGNSNIASFCLLAMASLCAFLFFNFNPAKIFMGDAGSLALGAALCGVAIILHKELLLLLIGGVYIAEVLSVVIQAAYFKMTGKRILRMSPLHHHFELGGSSEIKVVRSFWAVSFMLALAASVIR
ncbi:MAG: phospho-N-acetylmuramoyl-pentapeptide-transferase [Candidatus Margulisiibacteriota bacterium]